MRLAAVLMGVLLCAPAVAAQDSTRFQSVDRIVAVVGGTAILWSELQEEVNLMRSEGMQVPEDPAQTAPFLHQILEQMIQEELLVQQANGDTLVKVADQQVSASVDEVVRRVRAQFTTEQEYRRQLALAGFGTPEEYRRFFIDRRRREMLVQALLQSLQQRDKIRPIPPTESELRTFFQATIAQQPQRPASVSFRLIVVRPQPTPVADSTAHARADSLRAQLNHGADFEQLARRFSDDSSSAVQGGELGWLRRGETVREFEQVIFGIRVGSTSPVFKSPFGYHIAQVERTEPGEVQVRHILIAPDISDADRAAARDTAARVAAALSNGTPFDSLLRRYHDPNEQSVFDGVARDDLYASVKDAITDATPGQVVGPFLVSEGGRDRFGVLLFQEERPAGDYTFEELRDVLRTQLAQQNMVARFVTGLRDATYVDERL